METAYGFLNIVAFALLVFGLIRAISIFIQIFVAEKASQEVAYAFATISMINSSGSPSAFMIRRQQEN